MLLDSYHFWPRLLPLPRSAASGRVGHAFVARSQRFLELLGAGTDSGEQAKASKGQRICDIKSISMVFIFGLGPSQPSITNPKFKQPQWYFSPQGFVFCLPEKNGMILGNSWLLGWCATALDPRFMGSQTSFCCWSACTSASTAWQSCFMAAFSKTFFGILKWRFPGFLSHGCSPKSSTWWSFGAHSCCDDQKKPCNLTMASIISV
jgi:hypothetical protein